MKVSLNWIKQYTTIELETNQLIDMIAAQIAEIESITDMRSWYDGVVLGTIVAAADHPNADKLGVYQVSIGTDDPVQVCAGDKSLQVGNRVGYIPPGSAVPLSVAEGEPFIIESRELRGEASNGMLCSEKELGLGDTHEGVLQIDPNDITAADGSSLAEVLELDDVIIEVENKALTHRPDAFGVIGFAREIAGIQHVQMKSPDWLFADNELPIEVKELPLTVENNAKDTCYRFTAVVMDNVTIKPSPMLLRSYLLRLGVKSINNVVDITNYLMLATGQPLHAFDYDKVKKLSGDHPTLEVRYATDGEQLALLDGRTIKLSTQNMVIATDRQALSVAGAIGGTESEVDDSTTRVIVEVGNFDLYNLRKTSMQHGIFTDAVTRFIRGQDPASCAPVSTQSLRMLQDLAGADVASVRHDSFDKPREVRRILVAADRINNLLGTSLSADDMAQLLGNVELEVSVQANELAVLAPTWRPDLAIAEDITEEVGRLNGYNKLTAVLPSKSLKAAELSELETTKRLLRSTLVAAGANELLTYSFIPESLLDICGIPHDATYRIRNALRPELQRLRPSITPSLLQTVYANIRKGFDEFAFFEIGKTHTTKRTDNELPEEMQTLAFSYVASDKLAEQKQGSAYFMAREYAAHLLGSRVTFRPLKSELLADLDLIAHVFESSRSAIISIDGTAIGIIGEYRADVRKKLKVPAYAAGFELNIGALLTTHSARQQPYTRLSKFPSVSQDITVESAASQPFSSVAQAVRSAVDGITEVSVDIAPIDIFMPDADQNRRTTFRLTYQSSEATLKTADVSAMSDSVLAEAHKILN